MEASATELTSEDTALHTVYSAFSVSETHFALSRVSAFPRCVFQMHWIKALSLHACEFCEIPPEISALSNLEDLFISECHALDSLCPEIGDLSNLTTLYFYCCKKFSAIPESIGRLQKLKTLYFITCTKLEKFPTSLVSLGSLESLIIDETGIKELPAGMDFMPCLKNLTVSGRGLTEMTSSIVSIKGLAFLKFDCANLTSIPESIGDLCNLKKLHLTNANELECLPVSICGISGLETLDISGCLKLTEIPDFFSMLKKLKRFYMSHCNILAMIPDSIGDAEALEHLSICSFTPGNNFIEKLPSSIGRLKRLECLFLSSRKAERMPSSFAFLPVDMQFEPDEHWKLGATDTRVRDLIPLGFRCAECSEPGKLVACTNTWHSVNDFMRKSNMLYRMALLILASHRKRRENRAPVLPNELLFMIFEEFLGKDGMV